MKPTVLIDTNLWVSALLNPSGQLARLKDAWVRGKFNLVISSYLMEELVEVLTRKYRNFHFFDKIYRMKQDKYKRQKNL